MSLLQGKDDAAQLRFARRWVNCHVDVAAHIGKPVVLAEFGKKGSGAARQEFFQKVSPDNSDPRKCASMAVCWLTQSPRTATS